MPLSLGDLLAKSFPPESFLISSGLMHWRSTLVIGGPPKSYKSFFATTMLLQMAAGRPLWNASRIGKHGERTAAFQPHHPCKVLLLEQEVGEVYLQRRLAAMVAALPSDAAELCRKNFIIHSCDRTLRLDEAAGQAALTKLAHDYRPDIICLDPLKEFHSANENSAQEMGTVLRPLSIIKDVVGCSLVICHHTGKPSKDDAREGAEKLRGSSYLHGWGDTFLILSHAGRKAGRIHVHTQIRHGAPLPNFHVHLDRESLLMNFDKWGVGVDREGMDEPLEGERTANENRGELREGAF